MTAQQIKNLVDDAIALHRHIAASTEELKTLKALLIEEAHLRPEDLVLTESGGRRWTAQGSDGSIARVNFPAPGLISEVEVPSELATQLQALLGNNFRQLFTTVKTYLPVEDFRDRADELLPIGKVAALLTLCEREASPRVGFEIAKRPVRANA